MLFALLQNTVEVSVAVGAVILLLLLLSPWLGRTFAAKWKYWIWLLLAVRLLVPFNITLPKAPVQLPAPVREAAGFAQQPAPVQPANPAPARNPPDPVPTLDHDGGNTLAPSLPGALGLLWAGGGASFLLYQAGAYLACKRRLLRWSRGVTDRRVEATLARLQQEMNLARIPVPLLCENATSPMIIGFFKHYLILPRQDYTDGDLYLILKHELVHLRRGDVWYKLVLLTACAVHWFNPVVHLLFREAGKDLELACDDEVVRGLPLECRRAYSKTILSAAHHGKLSGAALSTDFRGNARTLQERFRNLLSGGNKRRGVAAGFCAVLCAVLVGGMVACSVSVSIDLADTESLTAAYLRHPFAAIMITGSWEDPEELDPHKFAYYYASLALSNGASFDEYWDDGDEYGTLIPADVLEPEVRSHFDVSTEFLRSADNYIAERDAYEFGGLGGASDAYVVRAEQRGKRLSLHYEVMNGMGNRSGSGTLHMELDGEGYRYLSNEYQQAASALLTFPAAENIVVAGNTVTMSAGGQVSIGYGPDYEMVDYDGTDIDSIVRYYVSTAFPELEAREQTQMLEVGGIAQWSWEGDYRDGKPLAVEVTRFNDEYIITAVFDEGEARNVFPYGPIIEAGLVNLYDRSLVTRAYVWPLIPAGEVLGGSWDSPDQISADHLVDICAYNNLAGLPLRDENQPVWNGGEYRDQNAPAKAVEAALALYFHVDAPYLRTSSRYDAASGTYVMRSGWDGEWSYVASDVRRDGETLTIDVGTRADGEEPIPWSTLTLQLQPDGGIRYLSNRVTGQRPEDSALAVASEN